MAFANVNISDLIATGIESRTGEIADNVLDNNPVSAQLKKKGRVKTFSGGHKIIEELSFAENPNGGAYSGYDTLPIAPADVISASEWTIKQYAVPVIISGLEQIQNSGREGLIDLLDSRLEVAEATMANIFETDIQSDGTNYGGKALDGLSKIIEAQADASQTATVGGISRTTWSFWRSHYTNPSTNTAAEVQAAFTTMVADLTRGGDKPDLIVTGQTVWSNYMASLQAIQRFTSPDNANLGFSTVDFMGIPVVLGGGMGGVMNALHALFLNTRYLRLRPFSGRNFVPLSPTRRWAVNQDAEVQILAWAGNITCRGAKFQGRLVASD
jgi:hypothetical protein